MNSKKYELEVTFNEYVGNFEREFCAYVFGYSDYGCHDWIQKLADNFELEEGKEFMESFNEYLAPFNDEHWLTICYIASENVLCIKFEKNPMEHIPLLVRRMEKFPLVLAESWEFAPKTVKILKVTLNEEITDIQKTQIL